MFNSMCFSVSAQDVIIEKRIFNPDYDNIIYKRNNVFRYSYNYELNGESFKMALSSDGGKLRWVNENIIENEYLILNEITWEVIKPKLFSRTNRFQSELLFTYFFNKNDFSLREWTGLVENKDNIWIHPPRANLFNILELSPFPFVKLPLSLDKTWFSAIGITKKWYKILSHEGDWQGLFYHKAEYRVIDHKNITTQAGKIDCWIIQAKAESELGKTTSLFYFNEKYGFVKLAYENFDGSNLTFELIEFPY